MPTRKMGETSRKVDMEELMTYLDNLIGVFKADKDVVALKHSIRQSEALHSQCAKDFNELQESIEDYEKKIYACKQKTAAAVSETVSDAELDSLQEELEEEQQLEKMLKEELRVIINEIGNLERQRVSVEEEMQTLKKFEQDEQRDQMKLSLYASVTNTIPCFDDPSKISGYIVAREKNVVEKFAFDPSDETAFDICNNIRKMINTVVD